MSFAKASLRALALVGALVLATSALLLVAGYPVAPALLALWHGSLGSWYSLTSATLVRAVPLMLTGGAVAVAFRAGVFNIGAEGQLLVGAAAAAAVALALPGAGFATTVFAIVAAAIAGGAWAGIAALLRARFGVLEVISTIMLNFVAVHAVSYLVRGPLQEPTHVYPQTMTIADAVHLPCEPPGSRRPGAASSGRRAR